MKFSPKISCRFRGRIANYSAQNFHKIGYESIFDPTFKGSIQVNQDYLIDFATASNGKFLDRVLKENLYVEISGLEMPRNHRFYEIFDEKFQQLFAAGIIDHYRDKWVKLTKPKHYRHLRDSCPKVLTMELLEAGFVVWLVSLTAAFVVFVCEWILTGLKWLVVEKVLSVYFDVMMKRSIRKVRVKIRFIAVQPVCV